MNKKYFLYSSQLAAFVGRNPHTNACRVFNKLYEKYFEEIIKSYKLENQIKERNVGDTAKLQNISNKIGDKKLLIKVDDLCKRNLSTQSLQKERTELIKQLESNTKLGEEEKKEIKKAVEGYTNKKFGTIREVNALDVYKEKFACEVITKIQQRSKKILEIDGHELWLISRLDGMKMDGTVVEIKNRIYKLFEEVREYEWMQVQAYLQVYGLPKAELVEYLKTSDGVMKVNMIEKDDKYWEDVMKKEMGYYFCVFLRLIGNEKKMRKYMALGETEQNEYIKSMVRKEKKK